MDRTVKEMSSEELEKYKKGLREKLFKEKEALEERYKRAWEVAEKAAGLLYSKYKAGKVVVFGSLTNRANFTKWSDIDIGVSGLDDEVFFKAVADVVFLNDEFKIDLVDLETCSASLKEKIIREGKEL